MGRVEHRFSVSQIQAEVESIEIAIAHVKKTDRGPVAQSDRASDS